MIVTDHQPGRVSVTVYGEFSLADYKEFEELVNFKVKFEGPVDLLFDLREMVDFTLDVAWEDIVFGGTGDDVIHVLDRYLDFFAKIRAEAEAEAPLLRAALRWFPKALSEKQEMKFHGMG